MPPDCPGHEMKPQPGKALGKQAKVLVDPEVFPGTMQHLHLCFLDSLAKNGPEA